MPRTKNKQKKLHIKKGDRVRVIAGNSKGSEGKVIRIFRERERAIVEGVNVRVRHTRPSQTNPQGGRMEREMPIHASNAMRLDSSSNPNRMGIRRIHNPDSGLGYWVRHAQTTVEVLDS